MSGLGGARGRRPHHPVGHELGRLTFELARSGFRFNALMLRMARDDQRTPGEITAALRAMVGGRRRPPGTATADPLMDVLVHGQDIAIPLGVERTMPVPAAVVAAQRLWTMGFPFNARKRFAEVTFIATDARFQRRTGEAVRGSDPGHPDDAVGPAGCRSWPVE